MNGPTSAASGGGISSSTSVRIHPQRKLTKGVPYRVHIHVSGAAKPEFPLQPYIQAGWGDADVPVGTVVVPVHPSLVGDMNLKRACQLEEQKG